MSELTVEQAINELHKVAVGPRGSNFTSPRQIQEESVSRAKIIAEIDRQQTEAEQSLKSWKKLQRVLVAGEAVEISSSEGDFVLFLCDLEGLIVSTRRLAELHDDPASVCRCLVDGEWCLKTLHHEGDHSPVADDEPGDSVD